MGNNVSPVCSEMEIEDWLQRLFCKINSMFYGVSRVPLLIALLLSLLFIFNANRANAQEFDHTHHFFDRVVKEFVRDGMVNYTGMKANPGELDLYLAVLARVKEAEFDSWDESHKLAYLINLYNAATLRLILDDYPLKSIKDIGNFFKGPWDQPVVPLFGETITLDTLEHEILRKDFSEPRIHVALVCAAMGCPPLRSEAYSAANLDTQLDDQAVQFLNNPIKFRIDWQKDEVHLSPIFKWYGNDFIKKYTPTEGYEKFNIKERAVLHFCSAYLSSEDQLYLKTQRYSVKYLDYDWSLNAMGGTK